MNDDFYTTDTETEETAEAAKAAETAGTGETVMRLLLTREKPRQLRK